MDWSTYEVESTIVHYVPTSRDEQDPQLLLTSAEIDLDEDLTEYFASKVTDRLEKKGLEVVEDPDQDQTAPAALDAILRTPQQFVEQSQILASRLFRVQSANNSSGLLAVLTGMIEGRRCVATVKLERQRGVSFAIDPTTGTVDLELLRNLTLTDKTKVYKTALFVAGTDGSMLEGYVADDQRTSAVGRQVASFFLGDYLGCKPKEPAALMTARFVKVANDSINADVESPETRGRYQVALLAKMQDNTADIRPATFARDNLDEPHREPFLERVRAAGIDPVVTFTKDTSRVKVDGFRMTFASGMVLVGSQEALSDNVEIPDHPGRDRPVQLKDDVNLILTGR